MSIHKDCLLLLYLAVVMVVFIVAMLKLNLERLPKQNIYIPLRLVKIHGRDFNRSVHFLR